ncbi:MAG TPA: aspartate carbamoyltransferase catalytic subunit [Woeseiaceae bacterium]|nr:aspartate carbamoyltransferase catalytic subunit [Woeseiaceae bacterium]|tara:strand:+ start:14310 stop:15293 length:984 start_codon:yes stop_codon:yes gene_type:complete
MHTDSKNESQLQLSPDGKLQHLLTLKDLGKDIILSILQQAEKFSQSKSISDNQKRITQDCTIANLFFEPSTRTRGSFEMASKYLHSNIINIDIRNSSEKKGETLLDTAKTIKSLGANALVIRHSNIGAHKRITEEIGNECIIINAGEGHVSHPTQGLLDMLTINQEKGRLEGLIITIVGDISHSRVAQSAAQGLTTMGAQEIRLVSPKEFTPTENLTSISTHYNDLNEGIENADVIMALRIQHERMKNTENIQNLNDYFKNYGITHEKMRLAAPDAIIMHPGPMNRDVEIESSLADSHQSVILKQVANGVAVRMAVLLELLNNQKDT